jgi:hypothetical protein
MGDKIGKIGFAKMFGESEKGSNAKKKEQVEPKPLDLTKQAAKNEVTKAKSSQDKAQESNVGSSTTHGTEKSWFQRGFLERESQKKDISRQNPASSSKKEVTETPKPVAEDKAQHSDAGSSSDSGKIGEIPAIFKYVSGNTDLAKAQICIIGEYHGFAPCHEANVNIIDTYANDGDIVLVEGVEAKRQMTHKQFLDWEEKIYNKKLEMFSKKVQIYGGDNMAMHIKTAELFTSLDAACNTLYAAIKRIDLDEIQKLREKIEDIQRSANEMRIERDKSFLETINDMRENFPDKRVFVIIGAKHVDNLSNSEYLNKQKYIALKPKNDLKQEDKQYLSDRRQSLVREGLTRY